MPVGRSRGKQDARPGRAPPSPAHSGARPIGVPKGGRVTAPHRAHWLIRLPIRPLGQSGRAALAGAEARRPQ